MTADTFSLCINTYRGGLTGAWHTLSFVQTTKQRREGLMEGIIGGLCWEG